MLGASSTICVHIEKYASMKNSLNLHFGSAINVLNLADKWELKWVPKKYDEEYLIVILAADSE